MLIMNKLERILDIWQRVSDKRIKVAVDLMMLKYYLDAEDNNVKALIKDLKKQVGVLIRREDKLGWMAIKERISVAYKGIYRCADESFRRLDPYISVIRTYFN